MADKNKFSEEKKGGYKIFNLILSRYFNLIVLILVLIFFAAAYFYLINPKRQKILDEREKILTEKIEQKDKLQNIFVRIEKYKADYGAISAGDKEKMNKIFISGLGGNDYDKNKLFTLFESLINGQGLILKSVNINDLSQNSKDKTKKTDAGLPAGVGKVEITLDISGVNYKSFKNLLDKIENNLLIMDITDLSFAPDASSANLKITVYYFKQ
jgi:hypothetical protein